MAFETLVERLLKSAVVKAIATYFPTTVLLILCLAAFFNEVPTVKDRLQEPTKHQVESMVPQEESMESQEELMARCEESMRSRAESTDPETRAQALKEQRDLLSVHLCAVRSKFESAKKQANINYANYEQAPKISKDCARIFRDHQRTIQTQENEILKLQHQVARAGDIMQKNKDMARDIDTLNQQVKEKDEQLWVATGRLTVADQKLAKLQAAEGGEYSLNEYTCALKAISYRDQTINEINEAVAFRDETINGFKLNIRGYEQNINGLEQTVTSLEQTVVTHKQAIDGLENTITSRDEIINKFVQKAEELGQKLKDMTANCSEGHTEQPEKSAAVLRLLRHKLEESRSVCTQLSQGYQVNLKQLDAARKRVDELMTPIEAHQNQNLELEAKLARVTQRLNAEKQNILDALSSTQHSLHTSKEAIKSKDSTMHGLRLQLKNANERIEKADAKAEHYLDVQLLADSRGKAYINSQAQLKMVMSQLNITEQELKNAKEQLVEALPLLKATQEELETAKKVQSDKKCNGAFCSEAKTEAITEQIRQFQDRAVRAESILEDREEELARTNRLADEFKRRIESAADESCERAETELRESEEELAEANTQLTKSERRCDDIMQDATDTMQRLEADKVAANKRCELAEKLSQGIQGELLQTNNLLARFQERCKELTTTTDDLKSRLDVAEKRAGTQICDYKGQLTAAREQREQAEKISREREAELAKINALHDTLAQKYMSLEELTMNFRRSAEASNDGFRRANTEAYTCKAQLEHCQREIETLRKQEDEVAQAKLSTAEHEKTNDELLNISKQLKNRLSTANDRILRAETETREHKDKLAVTANELKTTASQLKSATDMTLLQQDKLNNYAADVERVQGEAKMQEERLLAHLNKVIGECEKSNDKAKDREEVVKSLTWLLEEREEVAKGLRQEVNRFVEIERREGFVEVEADDYEDGFELEEVEEPEQQLAEDGAFEDLGEETEMLNEENDFQGVPAEQW